MKLDFRRTKDYSAFSPIVAECTRDLGPRFPESMANWCGIGARPYPLKSWEVFVAASANDVVGVCSYYQEINEEDDIYWIGWLCVRPTYRRMGIGKDMIGFILKMVADLGAKTVFVHTTAGNRPAIQFYRRLGFVDVGKLAERAVTQASAEADSIVLRRELEQGGAGDGPPHHS